MNFLRRFRASLGRNLLVLTAASAFVAGQAQAFDRVWVKNPEAVSSGTTTRILATLNNGDIIVGGHTGASNATQDFLVYRINTADGSTVWRRTVNNASGDDVNDLIADPATGDTYFCGRTSVTGQGLNWYVMKLNGADGTDGWSAPYTYTTSGANNDEPRSLSFVTDGSATNIVVVGMQAPGGTPCGYIVKLNSGTGALMWSDSPTSQLWVVRTNSSGSIFVGGELFWSPVATMSKYAVAGGSQWSFNYSPNGGSFNRWNFMAIDPVSGDPVVAGLISGPSGGSSFNDIGVARYRASDGAMLWSRLINGTLNDNDSASGIMVENGGDVYVLGTIRQATATGGDWYIGRVSLAAGTVVWGQSYSGNTGTTGDQVANIAVVSNTLYVAGYLANSSPGRTSVIMTMNKADGTTIARTDFTDRVGGQIVGPKALMVASNGDMIVASDSGATVGQGEIIRYGVAAVAPTVTTAAYANVDTTSATLGGNVTVGGSATVTDRGIVWSTTSTPTVANNKVAIGSGTGAFSQSVTGLPSSTTIYVRAYAINTAGTSYGSMVSFTTLTPDTTPPSVISVARRTPSGQTFGASTTAVTFRVTYSEPVLGVSISGFVVEGVNGGTVTGTIGSPVSVSSSIYDIPVTITGGTGEFRLKVVN